MENRTETTEEHKMDSGGCIDGVERMANCCLKA